MHPSGSGSQEGLDKGLGPFLPSPVPTPLSLTRWPQCLGWHSLSLSLEAFLRRRRADKGRQGAPQGPAAWSLSAASCDPSTFLPHSIRAALLPAACGALRGRQSHELRALHAEEAYRPQGSRGASPRLMSLLGETLIPDGTGTMVLNSPSLLSHPLFTPSRCLLPTPHSKYSWRGLCYL